MICLQCQPDKKLSVFYAHEMLVVLKRVRCIDHYTTHHICDHGELDVVASRVVTLLPQEDLARPLERSYLSSRPATV